MYDNSSKGISYLAGFFMLLAFMFGCTLIAQQIAQLVWSQVSGASSSEFMEGLRNPKFMTANRIAHLINPLLGILLPSLVVAYMVHKKPIQFLGLTGKIESKQAGLTVLILFASLFAGAGMSYLNSLIPIPESLAASANQLEESYKGFITALAGFRNTSDLLISLVLIAFIPAVTEEVLFRGGLQNLLTRHTQNPWKSIIIVSAIFSLVHFSFYGFLTRFFLGIVLGAIFHYTGRLWLSILAHFLNNALAIVVMYVSIQQGKDINEAANAETQLWWGLLFIPAVAYLIIALKKASSTNTLQS